MIKYSQRKAFVYTTGYTFWLGGTDRVSEGIFKWVDGSSFKSAWWILGEPNSYGGDEDCLIFSKHHVAGFNDKECGYSSAFICEHKGFQMFSYFFKL